MTHPTFIIAGTLPAGTGHLYGLLIQHPEVYLPRPMQPECNFFFKSGEYEKGLDSYRRRWFANVGVGKKAVGERSSLLLSGEWVPERLARDVPRIKLIFLLRNPVDRAYANWRFTALAGHEDLPFTEALDAEERRMAEARQRSRFWGEIQPHAYFHRGLYARQIKSYLSCFPREQMLIMRSDELLHDPDGALVQVYQFLGVDQRFVAAPCADMSSPTVIDLERQTQLRRRSPIGFDAAVQRIREGLPPETELDVLLRRNVREGHEPLPADVRRALADRYAAANRELLALVSFPIQDWF